MLQSNRSAPPDIRGCCSGAMIGRNPARPIWRRVIFFSSGLFCLLPFIQAAAPKVCRRWERGDREGHNICLLKQTVVAAFGGRVSVCLYGRTVCTWPSAAVHWLDHLPSFLFSCEVCVLLYPLGEDWRAKNRLNGEGRLLSCCQQVSFSFFFFYNFFLSRPDGGSCTVS